MIQKILVNILKRVYLPYMVMEYYFFFSPKSWTK